MILCISYRFNHELVFGVSVKNLSKAERLIYGDSLMTHAMILTAVTDKVHSHNHAVQVCDCLVHSCVHAVLIQTVQREHTHSEFPKVYCMKVLPCVYAALIRCSFFFVVLSIPPFLSNPSCQDTFFPLVSLLSPIVSCSPSVSQDGKEGYEKWRVENSWGDDRGNKGNTKPSCCRAEA